MPNPSELKPFQTINGFQQLAESRRFKVFDTIPQPGEPAQPPETRAAATGAGQLTEQDSIATSKPKRNTRPPQRLGDFVPK
ncbi:hypothetical protein SASPL_139223 [Salvia splendens]|uniref:Uncharacterized protein n=1 Tax=Salvia splendens TaxID=180675 RepID=A0A8X8WUW8_SALSN|nr:hypothetical protein SASPL_139223 [Salvia splendens]